MVSHPQWKVARRHIVSLRHRLPGGWLQSIQDRLQGPQIPVAHDFPERLLDF